MVIHKADSQDGKNVPFLAKRCTFEAWIVVYYKEDLLKESLVAGYPKETGEKALGVWCALLSGAGKLDCVAYADVGKTSLRNRPPLRSMKRSSSCDPTSLHARNMT